MPYDQLHHKQAISAQDSTLSETDKGDYLLDAPTWRAAENAPVIYNSGLR